MTRLTTLDLTPLHRHMVGFDRMFDEMDRLFENSVNSQGYPPYNIAKLDEDGNEFMVSLAVAGFGMDNLNITKAVSYTHLRAHET